MPTLSICIPTRNRQTYLLQTLAGILASSETDFELVVADNSDGGAMVPEEFAALLDTRVCYLPPANQVLPMVENWSRAVEASSGDWIVVIGDDDHIDPSLCELLTRISVSFPDADALGWNRIDFNWPDNRDRKRATGMATGVRLLPVKPEAMQRALFTFENREARPGCPFGAYHGAVRRDLMERIRSRFGGRYFEHAVVDFESSCKVATEANKMIFCERPISVLGACLASNSAGTRTPELLKERLAIFEAEGGANIQRNDFPFPPFGLAPTIANVIRWFCETYNIDADGWETNFVHAAMNDCANAPSRALFEFQSKAYSDGFAEWCEGIYLNRFKPQWIDPDQRPVLTGFASNRLFVDEAIGDYESPFAFYSYLSAMLLPLAYVGRASEVKVAEAA